jgi:predicted ATPase
MSEPLRRLTIEGYKSIRKLENFELRPLNVLIGANGAGKSNFVGFFRLLRELIEQRLQLHIAVEGGADGCLYMGAKVTKRLAAKLHFGSNGYDFSLAPTADDRLVFQEEIIDRQGPTDGTKKLLGFGRSGHLEAKLKDEANLRGLQGGPSDSYFIFHAISSWVVYHFHDTSATAGARRMGQINDDEYLRPDGRNLAAFLYRIRHTHRESYERIRDLVRLALPFFDDFNLRPVTDKPDLTWLEWRQKDSDYSFKPYHLSDGTIRFICLATALLQPSPPATMLFDEPELGLHPAALNLLGNLFLQYVAGQDERFFSKQVIVSTQSALLLNEFAPEDIVVVERAQGQSFFRRLAQAELAEWLEEYSLGDLWQKNVLGGRPRSEQTPEEALQL